MAAHARTVQDDAHRKAREVLERYRSEVIADFGPELAELDSTFRWKLYAALIATALGAALLVLLFSVVPGSWRWYVTGGALLVLGIGLALSIPRMMETRSAERRKLKTEIDSRVSDRSAREFGHAGTAAGMYVQVSGRYIEVVDSQGRILSNAVLFGHSPRRIRGSVADAMVDQMARDTGEGAGQGDPWRSGRSR